MAGDDRITPISDLRNGYKNVNCIFIVIDEGTKQQTKDGSMVRKCRVADRTGSIIFSIWNDEAEAVHVGDILKLTRGYSSIWKGSLVLYCGKYGIVEKLGEFTMVFSETPDMSLRAESVSPRSCSPPPSHSRQNQNPPGGDSNGTDVGVYSDSRSQTSRGNPDSSLAPFADTHSDSEYQDSSRSSKGSSFQSQHHNVQHHPLSHSHSHGSNGRFHQSTHEDTKYNDRRTHHMHSHDNHMTSSNRHHPYSSRPSMNGWR